MKKADFQAICRTLTRGDIIILQIRPLQFMPLRNNNFSPLAHCVFLSANFDFIQVSYEGTINKAGVLSNGDKLPERINYARIEKIEKL